MIKIENLSYSYSDGITALKDINIEVKKGKIVSIIGQNGCGKSTLLKIMDGLIFAEKGNYFYDGIRINKETLKDLKVMLKFRSEVSYLFQDTDIQLFCPTVYEEIAFTLRQMDYCEKDIKRLVEDSMERLNITKISNRTPHTLSGGEKKKVALASILVHNPSVILMDEPTNNLDPKTRSVIVDMIIELNILGKTIIIATHDLFFVKELESEVFLMFDEHTGIYYNKFSSVMDDIETLNKANLIYKNAHIYRN